ncbi:MAG: IclR family transcriptional regulator [Anaerolineales bacterium]
MGISEPYPGTQAVLRAVALLKAFTDSQPELGLTELARTAGLNKTTTYRLLTALESEGMVARSSTTEAYRLGPEAIALGGRALRSNDLRTASHAELEALAEAVRETATLEVLADEGQVLILDEALGPFVVGNTQSIGTRWPAHATSTGKVLLAYLPKIKQEAALRGGLPRLTGKTIGSITALRRELARVREQGYATAVGELEAGFVAVSAPVFNHEGEVVAAISVGGPNARLTESRLPEIAGLVKQAATRISQRLGYRKP